MSEDRRSTDGQAGGVVRGVLGCFLTLGSTVLGVVVGAVFGWQHHVPDAPPGMGSEWHGLSQFVDQLVEAGVGVIAGGMIGMILGIAVSVLLLRRR